MFSKLKKKYRLAEWIKEQNPYIGCLQKSHLRSKDTQTERKGMKNDILWKWKQKESLRGNAYIRQKDFKTRL